MNRLKRFYPSGLPLRLRLTFWYLLTLTVVLLLFITLLYWQVQYNLVTQIDSVLQLTATQALAEIRPVEERLTFQNNEMTRELSRRLEDEGIIYLVAPDGAVWDRLGENDEFSVQPPVSGLMTIDDGDDRWRVYNQRVALPGIAASGWLQVAQEMDSLEESLEIFLFQIVLGLPLALFLAGVGGVFLA